MPVIEHFRSTEVALIGNRLIHERKEFEHLIEHRVKIEYVISEQEVKVNGRVKLGQCMKKGTLDKLLMGAVPDALEFEPYTFVCIFCKRWRVASERREWTVRDETYNYCETCDDTRRTFDVGAAGNRVIKQIEDRATDARLKALKGPPEPPGFFVIRMFGPCWRELKDEQKEFLVDHELRHAGARFDDNGDTQLHIIPHDIEEFTGGIRRYGPQIMEDIRAVANALEAFDRQMKLDYIEGQRAA